MNLASKSSTAVGLDVGRYAVKAVRAVRRGGRGELVKADMLRLPADGSDPTELIRRWFGQTGHAAFPCVVGLSAQAAVFQPLTLAADDPRTAEQAAAIEMGRFHEMSAEPMLHDFVALPEKAGEKRLLLCMAPASAVERTLEPLRRLGARVMDAIPAPAALLAAFESAEPAEQRPVLVADIGLGSTEVVVGDRKALRFASALPCGGHLFTEALATAWGVPAAQIDHAKATGSPILDGEPVVRAALRKAADRWTAELDTFLAVYRSSFSDPADQPCRLLLCGGGAALPGLPEYLGEKTGLPTARLAPRLEGGQTDQAASFGLAAGLALRGLGLGHATLSLLPEAHRHELALSRQKGHWIAAGVTALLILGVSLVGGYRDYLRMQGSLEAQRRSLHDRQELANQIENVRASNQVLLDMLAPVASLVRNGPMTRDLLLALARGKAEADWITLVSDAELYFPKAAQPTPTPAEPSPNRWRRGQPAPAPEEATSGTATNAPPARRVIVEGYTTGGDFSAVKALIANLRTNGVAAEADLLGDDQIVPEPRRDGAWAGARARRFVLDLKVPEP